MASQSLSPSVERIIEARQRDLGGFSVGRVLPHPSRRMVGPFIFVDQIGPAQFPPGRGIDVRPHPHIGLATVTYLFSGEIRHRDSLGVDQVIRPGDVNWMTAGRGIVHSERTDDDLRAKGHDLFGMQCWVALPAEAEDVAPAFDHHPAASLPETVSPEGTRLRLIAGEAFGSVSPVRTYSRLFYAAVESPAGAAIPIPDTYQERAVYVVSGSIGIGGTRIGPGEMAVFSALAPNTVAAFEPTRAVILGGDSIGPRNIWWNFVATSDARLDAARSAWTEAANAGFPKGGRFEMPPGEQDFIPLPDA